jgi:hypothetical protein
MTFFQCLIIKHCFLVTCLKNDVFRTCAFQKCCFQTKFLEIMVFFRMTCFWTMAVWQICFCLSYFQTMVVFMTFDLKDFFSNVLLLNIAFLVTCLKHDVFTQDMFYHQTTLLWLMFLFNDVFLDDVFLNDVLNDICSEIGLSGKVT